MFITKLQQVQPHTLLRFEGPRRDFYIAFGYLGAVHCHNEGWLLHIRILSYGGYAFFQVHKNLK